MENLVPNQMPASASMTDLVSFPLARQTGLKARTNYLLHLHADHHDYYFELPDRAVRQAAQSKSTSTLENRR